MIEYVEIIKPRISDINYGGHVGHVELVSILHEVRVQFLKKYNLSEIDIEGCALLMRELTLSYNNAAFWDNQLKITLTLEPSHGARIVFKYNVYNLSENNITAKADAAMVLVCKEQLKPIKPTLFFEKFENVSA